MKILEESDPRPHPVTAADNAHQRAAPPTPTETDQKRPLLAPDSATQPPPAAHDSQSDDAPNSGIRSRQARALVRALVTIPVLAGLASIAALVFLYLDRSSLGPIQSCSMSYMYPNYYRVPLAELLPTEIKREIQHPSHLYRYQLWRYVDGAYPVAPRWDWAGDNPSADEIYVIPVLFVHGNAGSPRQVRSIASHAAKQVVRVSATRNATLRFYAVDFNEELSALHPILLLSQASYISTAYKFLANRYHVPHIPIVSHSMGTIVTQLSGVPAHHILSLSSPLAFPPLPFFHSMSNIYDSLPSTIPLISVHGGPADTHIPPGSTTATRADFDHQSADKWTVGAEALVASPSCHLAILWCRELLAQLSLGLAKAVEQGTTSNTGVVGTYKSVWANNSLTPVAAQDMRILVSTGAKSGTWAGSKSPSHGTRTATVHLSGNSTVLILEPAFIHLQSVYTIDLSGCSFATFTQLDSSCAVDSTCNSRILATDARTATWAVPDPHRSLFSLLHIVVTPESCTLPIATDPITLTFTPSLRGTLALAAMQHGPSFTILSTFTSLALFLVFHSASTLRSAIGLALLHSQLLRHNLWMVRALFMVIGNSLALLLNHISLGLVLGWRAAYARRPRLAAGSLSALLALLALVTLPVPFQAMANAAVAVLVVATHWAATRRQFAHGAGLGSRVVALALAGVLVKAPAMHASVHASVKIWVNVPWRVVGEEVWRRWWGWVVVPFAG